MGKVSLGGLVNSGATPLLESELMGPAKEISFAEIVSPDGGSIRDSEFFKHYCAKQMLHIAQDDRTRFEHLLSWDRINDLLSLELLDRKLLRVTRDGRDIPPSLYRREDGERDIVESAKLHDLLKQNASVALNGVHYLSPPVRRLALQMEVALAEKLAVNAYMTFGPGGAFATHYDSHDVLVLQIHGSKHWFIYEKPEAAPIGYEPKPKPDPREVVFETVLQAGDVLFVPRGTYHRAAVTDTDSVHITFGIHTIKGLQFIDEVRKKAEEESLFREDLNPLRGPEALAEHERAVKARLCEIINDMSMSDFAEQWRKKRRAVDEFRLGPKEELSDGARLSPLVRYREAWRDALVKKGKQPSEAAERIMDSLIENPLATVRELTDQLSGVLDEDTIRSTLAQLVDDCWIEVVR